MRQLAPLAVAAALLAAPSAASADCPSAATGKRVAGQSEAAVVYESVVTGPRTTWWSCARDDDRLRQHDALAGADAQYLLAGDHVAVVERLVNTKYGEEWWYGEVFTAGGLPVGPRRVVGLRAYGSGGVREAQLSPGGHLVTLGQEGPPPSDVLTVDAGTERVQLVTASERETILDVHVTADTVRWQTPRGAFERRLEPVVRVRGFGRCAPAPERVWLQAANVGIVVTGSTIGRLATRYATCDPQTGRSRELGVFQARGIEGVVVEGRSVAVFERRERRGLRRLRVTGWTLGAPRRVRGWATGWSRRPELVEGAAGPGAVGWVVREGGRLRLGGVTAHRRVRLADHVVGDDVGELSVSRTTQGGLGARWYEDGRLQLRTTRR